MRDSHPPTRQRYFFSLVVRASRPHACHGEAESEAGGRVVGKSEIRLHLADFAGTSPKSEIRNQDSVDMAWLTGY